MTIRLRSITKRWLTTGRWFNNTKDYGIKLRFGWFGVPREYYARDWTERALYNQIYGKFPDIDSKARSWHDIQQVIDDWVKVTDRTTKPPSSTYVDPQAAVVEDQINEDIRADRNEKVRNKYSKVKVGDLKQYKQQRQEAFMHIFTNGELPENFASSYINLYNARNHYANKFHDTPGFSIKNWTSLTQQEKETLKEEYMELLQQGKMYKKGKLVPLKGNFNASSRTAKTVKN